MSFAKLRESVPDAWGGLAAMLVALPSAIAFGVAILGVLGPGFAAQGAVAGLVGAAVFGLVAAPLGGAPRLISAPCAPAAAVMGAFAADLMASCSMIGPPPQARILLLLTLVGLLAGLLQVLFGLVGGGRLIKFIPYPVVTGYLSGVAVLILLGQLPKLLALPKDAGLWTGLAHPGLWSVPALVVGLVTMAVMVLAPRLTRRVPAPIVGLGAGLAAYAALAWARPELRSLAGNPLVIGSFGAGGGSASSGFLSRWSTLGILTWDDARVILGPAVTLAVLLSIDTLKTCVVLDALTRSRHDSNRELLGQGAANVVSALLGGVPGAGTSGATLVNVGSGGATRLSGFLAGLFALLAFALAGRLIAWVPVSALAGILLVVAWRMFDRKSLALLRRRSTQFDFAVSAAVILVAVTVDLIAAAGAGLALAILLFIRDLISGNVIRRKTLGSEVFSKQRRLPAETAALEKLGSQTVVCELQGNLFFGTTDQLFTELEADLKVRRFVILDLRRVQSVDFTAVHMLKQIEDHLHARQGRLLLCSLPASLPSGQDLQSYFDEAGLVKATRNVSVFGELDEALGWAEARLLQEAGLSPKPSAPPLDLSEIELLREFPPEAIAMLRGCMRELTLEAGSKVFSRGEEGDEVFLIRRGRIRIVLPIEGGRHHHIATFARGDFFGEVAFLDRGTRTADAVAAAPTALYALSRARFNETAPRSPAVAAQVFARLARTLALRLRQADVELRTLQEA